jgi:hypothetical protein
MRNVEAQSKTAADSRPGQWSIGQIQICLETLIPIKVVGMFRGQ